MKLLGFLLVIRLTTIAEQAPSLRVVKKGQDIPLDCSLKADEGIYWFRQGKSSGPVFLLYVTGAGKIKPDNITKYKATKSFRKVSLMVKNVMTEDSGNYYCLMVKNMAMIFGKTIDLKLEEPKSTPKPTTIPITTKAKSTTPENKETTQCHSTKRAIKDDKMSCHMIIWAPLTGAAFLLLLALIIVSTVYCRRPRRRRCQHQFRKRPIPEEVSRPTNRYH
ncbi:T-cell surface glycoprotein CD8 alpha chain-like [Heterodontus francisci]|uniref:T-cell surface glycoprotein CD8 alpha chain-like n=1 Tax=Heterodontus francisci TaxID=7792 RepID=UPI00355BC1AD